MDGLLAQLAKEITALMQDEPGKIMETRDVAAYLHTTENEVRRMARAGDLPCLRLGEQQGHLRFHRDAINKALGMS